MNYSLEFFNRFKDKLITNIHSCTLGRIESFDAETMKAEVSPLVRYRNPDDSTEDRPLLLEVPVAFTKAGPFVIRPPYQNGDIVLVVFADEDIENVLLSGDLSNPNSKRVHSLDDALVIGGILPYNDSLPSDHSDDLIIALREFQTKIVLLENGDIIIQAEDQKILVKSKEKETIIAEDVETEIGGEVQIEVGEAVTIELGDEVNVTIGGNAKVTAPQVVVESGEILLGSDGADEGVPLGDTLKAWLDGHTHPIAWSSSAGSGTSGAPSSDSPDPSEVVKVE